MIEALMFIFLAAAFTIGYVVARYKHQGAERAAVLKFLEYQLEGMQETTLTGCKIPGVSDHEFLIARDGAEGAMSAILAAVEDGKHRP